MEDPEVLASELDREFDVHLADMKPFVLRLVHKSERQRCALWIKKMCEPPGSGISGRKNRNMYALLMLHMLKRGALEGPFTQRPGEGPLDTLPAYMSIYFDESTSVKGEEADRKNLPDWVNGLGDSSTVLRSSSMGEPSASSTLRQGMSSRERLAQITQSPSRRRTHTAIGIDRGRPSSPGRSRTYPSLPREKSPSRNRITFSDGEDVEDGRKSPHSSPVPSRSSIRSPTNRKANEGNDWSRPVNSLHGPSSLKGVSSFRDEQSLIRMHERELDMKTKMLEAKFHEEKLRMQQKHDSAVQKILDRKNAEIEDVKTHYRAKNREQEEQINKMEKKIQSLVKESAVVRENKDKQIAELKKLSEETTQSRQNEYEKKMHDLVADFEQEKFDMQKQHTKNIQELLEDTNGRLQKMEHEYSEQAVQTQSVIRELEDRVQQLTIEAQNTTADRNALERLKVELEHRMEETRTELQDYKSKYSILEQEHQKTLEDHDLTLRSLKNKNDATVEYLQQEHSLAAAKAADTISDLEDHIAHLKQELQDAETHRRGQIREMEQVQQQDKMHAENLHEKKVQSLKREMEHAEQESQKVIKKLEQTVKEKDEEIQKIIEQHRQHAQQSEQALTEFKSQVEKNSGRMYDEMKQQMEKVAADLSRSKQLREKQAQEFQKQIEDLKKVHEQELADLKFSVDQDKAQLLRNHHLEKESMLSDHEQELERVKENLRRELQDVEQRSQSRQDRDSKTVTELEAQVRELREEIVQSNQLRKQQLVELGLLREEEKQKMQRDHEAQVAKLKSETEQQKLSLQKSHSEEIEKNLEKTNVRLREIEKEYTQKSQKANEAIAELNKTIDILREEKNRLIQESNKRFSEISSKLEEEKRTMKRQHSNTMMGAQQQLDETRNHIRSLEKRLQQQEAEYEDKINDLRYQHENKMKGLMPVSLRNELEDTIASLKAQVTALQQRAEILQDELNTRDRYSSMGGGPRTLSPARSPIRT
ncbi:centrosomal protein of 112 kDa [Lingula anatina]|uniref:Centrosomal protein of 112 kDa n=1 Tax=Lingula anatina TaxID=7574 RepID=A0A1S3IXS6_LINAN|nr:centrosomal protein of 112 kDa [Lingula anatina]|eukprot:XP_013402833.1 centrosomal protein of 112 kDa [Lingula anatina]